MVATLSALFKTFLFTKNVCITVLLVLLDIEPTEGSMGTGKCPVVRNCTLLVWPNFQGIWYEYASYGDMTARTLYKCMRYTFTTNQTDVIAVRDFISIWEEDLSSTKYEVVYDGFYDFIMKPDSGNTIKMWVIDTDYANYAILWSCYDYYVGGYFYEDSSWILTRSARKYPTVDVEIKIDEALERHSFQRISYDSVSRENCPYIT